VSTVNISVSGPMKAFIESQVAARDHGTASDYVRELISKEQDRQHLRSVLLAGAESAAAPPGDADYFDSLRGRIAKKIATRASEPARYAPQAGQQSNPPDLTHGHDVRSDRDTQHS
jgi:antitoxin ParD1/3/4